MGYMHIENLYKNQDILLFKECYALEKIHGTSAHIYFNPEKDKLTFFSGGSKHGNFIKLFDESFLISKFKDLFNTNVLVFGEAYGGSCQRMQTTYGDKLKFIVFDVKVGNYWLSVPNAHDVATKLGLEFVDYVKIKTTLKNIDKERDKPSTQAIRNGCENDKEREGIVLKPLIELTKNNGDRIISKHKNDKFRETLTIRKVSREEMKILENAKEIANEWVTPMRLNHVMDKLDILNNIMFTNEDFKNIKRLIPAMIEDVHREAKNEIIVNKIVDKEIGRKTVILFKQHLNNLIGEK